MNFLHAEIGSAKDNQKSPIHNWYKFTAGFSHLFVDEIIKRESLNNRSKIFDPFAGCGTTLVASQKLEIPAVGNEAQEFMYDIIRAKLNWKINHLEFENHLDFIKSYINDNFNSFDFESTPHDLLKSLYVDDTLKKLYLIRDAINAMTGWKNKLFFKLALSQTLHKVSIHPIAVPYISRNKTLSNSHKSFDVFESICRQMLADTKGFSNNKKTSKIHLQDSRIVNENIGDGECNSCITSPPYLNNLDYGEVSKVHTHFFDITKNWNDVTNDVRKKLVTGATTHYKESEFNIEEFRKSKFFNDNTEVALNLIDTSQVIKGVSKQKAGKKSFDILTLLYFKDMYDVLREIRRIVRRNSNAYLILGDSAPYGIHIPTTEILGKIALNIGFESFAIHKIRSRGTKWKSLRFRHSLELTENVLVLK